MRNRNGATIKRGNLSGKKKRSKFNCKRDEVFANKIEIFKEKARIFMRRKKLKGSIEENGNNGIIVFHPEYKFPILKFTLWPMDRIPKKVALFCHIGSVGTCYTKNLSSRSIDEGLEKLAL